MKTATSRVAVGGVIPRFPGRPDQGFLGTEDIRTPKNQKINNNDEDDAIILW
jgi:hypothetical protein